MKVNYRHCACSQLTRFLLKNNKPERKILHSCYYWISLDLLFQSGVKTDIYLYVYSVEPTLSEQPLTLSTMNSQEHWTHSVLNVLDSLSGSHMLHKANKQLKGSKTFKQKQRYISLSTSSSVGICWDVLHTDRVSSSRKADQQIKGPDNLQSSVLLLKNAHFPAKSPMDQQLCGV